MRYAYLVEATGEASQVPQDALQELSYRRDGARPRGQLNMEQTPADTDFSSLSKFKCIITSMDFSDYLHCF